MLHKCKQNVYFWEKHAIFNIISDENTMILENYVANYTICLQKGGCCSHPIKIMID